MSTVEGGKRTDKLLQKLVCIVDLDTVLSKCSDWQHYSELRVLELYGVLSTPFYIERDCPVDKPNFRRKRTSATKRDPGQSGQDGNIGRFERVPTSLEYSYNAAFFDKNGLL
jgi:hypothetical protein